MSPQVFRTKEFERADNKKCRADIKYSVRTCNTVILPIMITSGMYQTNNKEMHWQTNKDQRVFFTFFPKN